MPKLKPICGIACLSQDPDGNVLGTSYPGDRGNLRDWYHGDKGRIERWGCILTEVARRYPYPEVPGFVPEGLVWLEIAKDYDDLTVNEPLRIYYPTPGSLSRRKRWPPSPGEVLYARAMIRRDWMYAGRWPMRFIKAGLLALLGGVWLSLTKGNGP